MAITTVDGMLAGFRPPAPYMKTGATMGAAGARRMHTHWYNAGLPGASSVNSVGINGAAVTLASGAAVSGMIPRRNPDSGNAHIGRLSFQASQTGCLYVLDRIWHNSGLSVTATTLQSITPAAWSNRDMNGASLGHGVIPGIEWSGSGGAGTPTVTLTYTNQDGTTGVTGTLTGLNTPPAGTIEMFDLAAGDTGVRAITGFQQSATRTSGTCHLVLFRILAQVEINAANMAASADGLTLGLPQVYGNSVLQTGFMATGTTATNLSMTYIETHG